jgi:hypothetical protein
MTRKLEELFNMDSSENIDEDVIDQTEDPLSSDLISQETLKTIEKIENALPQVRGLEASDTEMDELSNLAKGAFNNLMDLGMQVDARFSAEIFNSASSMLGHAITAKTAKMTKKLKMIDLQLKKAEIDRKIAAAKPNDPTPIGTGKVIDRNELIKMAIAEAAKNKRKDK